MEHPWSQLSTDGKSKVMGLIAKKLEVVAELRDEMLLFLLASAFVSAFSGKPFSTRASSSSCLRHSYDLAQEFIEQLLDNEKEPQEIQDDLQEILKDNTDSFVDWIFFTIAKTLESDKGASRPQVAGLNDVPWKAFERLLNLTFVLWCNGAEIDWKLEQMKLRQAVMTGLAVNSPAPPPPPSSPKYPPLLVLTQMNTWLRKFDFPLTGEASASTGDGSKVTNLFLEDDAFRTYLMSSLHTMGFILSQLLEADGEEKNAEDFLAPLADSATELFMRLVKGCNEVFAKAAAAQGGVTGEALYNKYKRMTGNAGPEDAEPTGTADASALAEDIKMALSALAPPMAEIFGRSAVCRAALRKHPWLNETIALRKENPRIRMLYDLANVLDEEFIVIHPLEKKGFRVFVSGCSDNKLLGLTLASTLIQSDKKEDNLLSGQRPNEAFIDMLSSKFEQEPATNSKFSHPWTFSIWTTVKSDGTVPAGMAGASNWIWSEGIPSQIPLWKGKRVLLLQKAPFPKPFEPVRMFGGLDATAKIDSVLTTAEIDALLKEIGQSSDEMRQEALKLHKQFQQ